MSELLSQESIAATMAYWDNWLAERVGRVDASQIHPDTRFHLSQSAAKIAATLPESREAALFLLAKAAEIHGTFFQEGAQ